MPKQSVSGQPIILVLSGPSGVGKDAVLLRMRELHKDFHFVVTATTRMKRQGETEGKDYIFLTRRSFEKIVESGGFLEWAEVYGNLYGVQKEQVTKALSSGLNVVIKIDVQGAHTLKLLAPKALFLFLAPPSMESLSSRLRKRMTESPEAFAIRFSTAKEEMKESTWFDHTIVNEDGDIDITVEKLRDIATSTRSTNVIMDYFSLP
ncbi:MAG: guanylate kinase [Chloroflexota bacterium]|nr:guanylate kinase [Chloroflexota bacterium]